jgi:hypothetical protein
MKRDRASKNVREGSNGNRESSNKLNIIDVTTNARRNPPKSVSFVWRYPRKIVSLAKLAIKVDRINEKKAVRDKAGKTL